jgi:ubiquitin-conjugating enzyme E2 H
MKASNKRIQRDIEKLSEKQDAAVEHIYNDTIHCMIYGPPDTPYIGLKWKIVISFPESYPFSSPSVGFIDKIWHPNVDYNSGSVCLNVLNQSWSPIYSGILIIDTFLPQLLTYPNPDDPLNEEAAEMYINNREQYDTECKSRSIKPKVYDF